VNPRGFGHDVPRTPRQHVRQHLALLQFGELIRREHGEVGDRDPQCASSPIEGFAGFGDPERVRRRAKASLHSRVSDGEHQISEVRCKSFNAERRPVKRNCAASDRGGLVHRAARRAGAVLGLLGQQNDLFRTRVALGQG
jgi:hypothetical protein